MGRMEQWVGRRGLVFVFHDLLLYYDLFDNDVGASGCSTQPWSLPSGRSDQPGDAWQNGTDQWREGDLGGIWSREALHPAGRGFAPLP